MKLADLQRTGFNGYLAVAFTICCCVLSCTPSTEMMQSSNQPSADTQMAPSEAADFRPPMLPIDPADTLTAQPAVVQQSVQEQQARFVLPPGYRMEPVLTEPAIKEPAAIAFDGNGRMYVLELRSYMQDADATDELLPTNRISRHEDLDNDGVYEHHTVFVDNLVFPRFVLPFGTNSILSMESNEDEVYRFTDTDGDGVADEKTLFTTNYGRAGNVEHQQAFLYWGMDNWLYSTYNAFRIRWTPNGILREPTGSNRAQWGVTQDNEGKIWFQGGASGLPSYFQFPVVYGNYDIKEPYEEGFEVPYGLAGLGDYQPGPRFSRPDGTLNRVTGSAGNDIYRGHRLPKDLLGHYLYGEPVARIVRRVEPVNTEGLTQLRNVYQADSSEFIRSTDPLFRPVDMATAPDGTIYIVDMYRGIIQEGNWTRKGTFLRAKIEQYNFDKAIGHGRIWRLVHESMDRDQTKPRMLEETPAQLVRHLAHPNGWWRDTAQQLLIVHQDRSVMPALVEMARHGESRYARYHALWTLEGLGVLEADLVDELLRDASPQIRIQALRASETLYKAGHTTLADAYHRLAQDKNPDVAIQAMLTMDVLGVPEVSATLQTAIAENPAEGVQFVGRKILTKPASPWPHYTGNPSRLSDAQKDQLTRGKSIYDELCSQCHGDTGRGTPLGNGQALAPALAGSDRVQGHRDYVIQTLLHGQKGAIDGLSYPGNIMVGMGENDDAWIAAIASYIRNSFTNEATWVSEEDVAKVRAASADRLEPWEHEALLSAIPFPLDNTAEWKMSASHNAAEAAGAVNFAGWSSKAPQEADMWFQIGLPEPVWLSEIQFTSNWHRRGRGDDAPPPLLTAPMAYQVQVSMDGLTWSDPIAEGEPEDVVTIIKFPPTRAAFVRITQTANSDEPRNWYMQKMKLFASPLTM